jgi:preprotein translocase SecF subunit
MSGLSRKIYPFIEWRFRAYAFTVMLFLLFGIATLFHGGVNWGIDFVGGTSVIVKLDQPVNSARLAELRASLEPLGLSSNIRTIGGGAGGSSEEIKEISIDVRGSGWVDEMTKRFLDARAAGGVTLEKLDGLYASVLQREAMVALKANFVPPPGDTTAAPLYDLAAITSTDLSEIFQTLFNENIGISIQRVLAAQMAPEGGPKNFDINNIGNAENLADALAGLKRKQAEAAIAATLSDTAAERPWKTVDEFLTVTKLNVFDAPELRRTLTADSIPAPRTISIMTATANELSGAFLPVFAERFLRNATIVVTHRDRDHGGVFGSAKQAADYVPEEDVEMRGLIATHAHAGRFIIASSETVGAAVGDDLKWAALSAIMISIIGLLIYIWFRFELRYAVGAIIATLHDTLLTIGLVSATGIEFSIPIVAAALTVMGYSINDTIVVYDRIREKLGKLKGSPDPHIIDLAISETLSRTVLTAGTTVVSILIFLFLGPAVTRGLSFTLTFGILIGTFSSIFVAAPVLVEWDRFRSAKK